MKVEELLSSPVGMKKLPFTLGKLTGGVPGVAGGAEQPREGKGQSCRKGAAVAPSEDGDHSNAMDRGEDVFLDEPSR
jgi:hypothetical protein